MSFSLKGTVMVWDLTTFKAIGGPGKLKHISDTRGMISFTALTRSGVPIVKVTKERLYGFQEDMKSWTVLGPTIMDEMKDKTRLDYGEIKLPARSPFLLDSAAALVGNKCDLMACFLDYLSSFIDNRRFESVHQLCHELWAGSGWICDRLPSDPPAPHRTTFQFSKADRLHLLHQAIQILDQQPDFRWISQEYRTLLKHASAP